MVRRLIADLSDIKSAVNAAREYSALAARARDAGAKREPLKAFLPD